MMEWYFPITIIPAMGLLIMSTTSLILGISGEIGHILKDGCTSFEHKLAGLKIKQLTRLTRAVTFLYVCCALMVLAGVTDATNLLDNFQIGPVVFALGILLFFVSLILLIVFGINTIKIRKMEFENMRPKDYNEGK